MSKRLIIALLATVALAAGLTACKPKETSTTTTVTPESSSTTTTTTTSS
ncbi:MAG TPA: hypothetical protein VHE99_04945 [Gammaproteobacteria bacterium]|nr:hypothetical protein [Gammaproteobacteria bacterium]